MKALKNGLDPERADALLDEIIRLTDEHGKVNCTVVDNRILSVQSGDTILCETPIRLVKSKLRTLCARLAVRCQEWSGRDVSLYGDELEFEHPGLHQRCKVRFENRPGCQRFEVENSEFITREKP